MIPTSYIGAFDASSTSAKTLGWAQGWTWMSELYYSAAATVSVANTQPSTFSLFPNPANQMVQVQLTTDAQQVELFLQDLQGRLLTSTFGTRLSLRNIPAGMYLLSVQVEGVTVGTEKLIVKQ